MAGKAAKIMVTQRQEAILQQIANAATTTVRHAQRARVILEAFQGELNRDIAVQVGLWALWAAGLQVALFLLADIRYYPRRFSHPAGMIQPCCRRQHHVTSRGPRKRDEVPIASVPLVTGCLSLSRHALTGF